MCALAIEAKHLRKEFESLTAVKDFTLSVREGIIFSLLGINGAGKTTTIRMLTGLTAPTSGSALVSGMDISRNLSEIKRIIGISPQETAVSPNLTIRENLELMCGLYLKNRAQISERANRLLSLFSMESEANRRARLLSGGWQRRLSIAMAMAGAPKILFLDEPTLGLDVLARRELWETILALRGSTTVILTTHYMEEAEHLSDETAIMSGGELRVCGTPDDLKADADADSLEEAFIKIVGGGDKNV